MTRKKTPRQWRAEMARWPDTWAGVPEDVPLGQKLVAELAPFVNDLASGTLAPATVSRHMGNLWLLGGEIVRDANLDADLRRHSAAELIDEALAPDEGPWLHDASEAEQRSFDATCRKLHRFRVAHSYL
ncbi:MAG: hypothetical protein M3463_18075 [Verrucomicrobiota bacterium]|nr:hypothetical protein [Verrucomicrobiota bacterium]